jgi:peptidoglycan/xylan/chitin deacetylase (PgdA/CDA1 family)
MTGALPRSLYTVSGPKRSRGICLTFDDGPHPEHTPALLDVLCCLGVPATFFVVGREAEQYPDLVRRIVAEGHDVGHHSFSHSEPATTSAGQLAAEVRETCRLLSPLTGRRPRLFRPPHGKVTIAKALFLWALRQRIVLWNADPKDFACRSSDEVVRWFQRHPVNGGDIVLMHDNHPYAAAALPFVASDVGRRGLTFCRLSDWRRHD